MNSACSNSSINILIAESLCETTMHRVITHMDQAKLVDAPVKDASDNIYFVYQPDISVKQIELQLKDYQGLIVRPKQVTKKAIEQSSYLKLIVRGGAGVNAIDCETAKAKNVVVENTPGLNSTATAEYSFALMLKLLAKRHIEQAYQDCIHDQAKAPEAYAGNEVAGKRIGIIGYGNIGRRMATRCLAFDMKVSVYNRSKKEGAFDYYQSLEELCSQPLDVLSVHIPLSLGTEAILNKALFNLLPRPVILINTARPQLVHVDDFKEALLNGKILSAGIDGDEDVIAPFIKADTQKQCLITPHIADSTFEAQSAIAEQVLKQTYAFFKENRIINQVI